MPFDCEMYGTHEWSQEERPSTGVAFLCAMAASFASGSNTKDQGGHPFTGYSLPFLNPDYLGLESTLSKDPPMLNWIYVDRETHEDKIWSPESGGNAAHRGLQLQERDCLNDYYAFHRGGG